MESLLSGELTPMPRVACHLHGAWDLKTTVCFAILRGEERDGLLCHPSGRGTSIAVLRLGAGRSLITCKQVYHTEVDGHFDSLSSTKSAVLFGCQTLHLFCGSHQKCRFSKRFSVPLFLLLPLYHYARQFRPKVFWRRKGVRSRSCILT